MKRLVSLPTWLWLALALGLVADGLRADTAESPYLGIAGRNVFGLRPILPPHYEPPPAPLAKVKVVGITTFGGKRALLDVHLPANPPEPAKEVASILTVGQREGKIRVLEIDEVAGCVKVDNDGTVMTLVLALSPTPRSPPDLPPLPVQTMSRR